MINPYKKDSEETKMPLMSTMTMFDFSSGGAMEDELQYGEMCVARIPNLSPTGFTHNVALVYKDIKGDVYSMGMMAHHGILKNTKENNDALQEQSTGGVSGGERTESVPEVQSGEQSGGSEHVESTVQKEINSNENQRQHTLRPNPKGGKKAKRKKVKKGRKH